MMMKREKVDKLGESMVARYRYLEAVAYIRGVIGVIYPPLESWG